jgi:Raf kinase inhibitor-like YbhB/YbcL family protein
MDRHVNRRTLLSAATITAAGLFTGGMTIRGTSAQSTPVVSGTPVTGGAMVEGRNPYEFLAGLPTFTVTSTDVGDGQEMPAPQRSGIFGAGGEDVSPQLSWSGQPDGVQGYAITMFDPDAPTPSGFWHWAVMNIPGDTTELASGAGAPDSTDLPEGSVQLPNDAGLAQYVGAAPPPGPSHRYFIAVFALDVPTFDIAPDSTPALLSFTMLGHILAYGLLVPIATTSA